MEATAICRKLALEFGRLKLSSRTVLDLVNRAGVGCGPVRERFAAANVVDSAFLELEQKASQPSSSPSMQHVTVDRRLPRTIPYQSTDSWKEQLTSPETVVVLG